MAWINVSQFSMSRRAVEPEPVAVPDVVVPTYSLDGWTLESTCLRGRLPEETEGELATLLHYVRVGVRTPWTYERAAQVLEEIREQAQALAICERYFTLCGNSDSVRQTARPLERRRNRLREQLAPVQQVDSAAPSAAPVTQPESVEAEPVEAEQVELEPVEAELATEGEPAAAR